MRVHRALGVVMVLWMGVALSAATNIEVSNEVLVPAVKRFGINLNFHFYYDRVILKNLAWRNAGFEGLLYQSIVRCATGTPTGCIDDNIYTQWPTGFWDDAEYEFVLGTAKGRSGTVTHSMAPAAPDGTTYVFADSGVTPATGDYLVVRKVRPGGADAGWNPVVVGGAAIGTELADLPPSTAGRQAIRLNASQAGQTAIVTGSIGWFGGSPFLLMNGTYRLTFKAKGLGGANRVVCSVARPATSTQFLVRNELLTPSWQTYTVDFSAAEGGTPAGFVDLRFQVSGSTVLLDDVSLVQTNVDPANTSPFRDPVIAALRELDPGILRGVNLDLGDSFDNSIAPPFGRQRTQYTAYGTSTTTMQYGLHELLETAEMLGAEPWWNIPVTFTDREMRDLMEYLGGDAGTPYGARRAARGHPEPWTSVFPRIHLEFANESWNPVFRGGAMERPASYGRRGTDLFAIAKATPWYDAGQFNLVLGVQTAGVHNTRETHNASAHHDTITVGPYMTSRIDSFANNEELFGTLFAEATWWSSPSGTPVGFMRQTHDVLAASARPVPMSVYEVNVHTTEGSISQQALDAYAPSVGAGVGVANHMMNMLRELHVRDQVLFSLGGFRTDRTDGKNVALFGVTRDVGVTDRKRPAFLATRLANEALAGDLVRTTHSGDDPRWNHPLMNRIRIDGVRHVQSFAFVSGSRRAVVLFNLHRTDALEVTFSGVNAPSGSVTMRQLTGQTINDNNESAENVAITTRTLAAFDAQQPMVLPPFSMTVILSNDPATARRIGDIRCALPLPCEPD